MVANEKNISNIEQMCDELIAQSSDEDLGQLLKLEKLKNVMWLQDLRDQLQML